MNLRRTLAAATAGLALAGGAAFAPASAVDVLGTDVDVAVSCSTATDTCSGSTPVQLTVVGGGTLAISVPTPAPNTRVSLGSVNAGAIAATTSSLGAVKVTDGRFGLLDNNWVVAAQASDLVLSTKTAETAALNEKILAATVGYTPGAMTSIQAPTVGTGPLGTPSASLATAIPVVTNVAVGANTFSWDPTLLVTVPSNTVPGTYVGTVTHSAL